MASTPYRKLIELAHARALDGKAGLAASVAEMCLAPSARLTQAEIALAYDVLRLLIARVESDSRRHIADYLAERPDAPQDLIRTLANDDITVAHPIILNSRILRHDDLLDVIATKTTRHRQAIAVRPDLPSEVTDTLIAYNEVEVMITLLCNHSAEIGYASMRKMVELSIEAESLQEPLVHRSEMTAELAQRLYVWVNDGLRDVIVANYRIDPAGQPADQTPAESIAVITTAADAAPAVAPSTSAAGPGDGEQPAPNGDFADGFALLRYLQANDMQGFESALASRLDLSPRAISLILYESGLESLAIACKAAGIEKEIFSKILCHLSGSSPAEDFTVSQDYIKAVRFFDRIDHAAASDELNRWRESPIERRSA